MPVTGEAERTVVPQLNHLLELDPLLQPYEGEIRRR